MAVTFNSSGSRQTFFSKPTDTNAATIYTANEVRSSTFEAINICTTGACDVTVWINNGTTDYLLLDAFPMAANSELLHSFGSPVMRDGWSIKVKTSNADDATFVLTVAEETGRLGAQLG